MWGWLGAVVVAAATWHQDKIRLLRKRTIFKIPNTYPRWVDALAAKPDGLSSILATQMVEGEN